MSFSLFRNFSFHKLEKECTREVRGNNKTLREKRKKSFLFHIRWVQDDDTIIMAPMP